VKEIPYEDIIAHLNKLAGTNYRYKSTKNQSLIRARWKEGYRLEDFCRVHENKIFDWLNTDMAIYIRPITLYGSKFENYLNQPRKVTNITNKDKSNILAAKKFLERLEDEDKCVKKITKSSVQ